MVRRASVLAFCMSVIVWGACCRLGTADVVLSIQDEDVVPGGTAYVSFFAKSNIGYTISGFNLPTDINDDQLSTLPTGFTLNAIPIQNRLFNNTIFDTPPSIVPAKVDGIITGNGVNQTLGILPTKLFDLVINVASTVPVGTRIPIELLIPGDGLSSLFAVSGPSNPPVLAPTSTTSVIGYIAVVPEPSSFALLSLIGLLGGGIQAWRRAAGNQAVLS